MNDDKKPGDSDTPPEGADTNTDKDGLNDLLASWDDKPKADSKADDTPPKSDDSGLVEEVARLSYEREMDKMIPMIKGDLKVSDKFVEAYMNMRANDDPRLRSLWEDRHSHRADFEKAMTMLSDDLKAEVSAPAGKEPKPADDDKGLAAAVNRAKQIDAGSGGPEDKDVGSMPDGEFALYKAEVFRLAEQDKLKPE